MALAPSTEKFIASWGKMASKWCANRTVAEVHALFFLSAEPLNAEDITHALAFSRSNVSASLRELESRGLINPVYVRGDRKQYYEATKDPWEAFRRILDEQKRRAVDPTVATFRACLDEQARTFPEDSYTAERMSEVLSLFEAVLSLYSELRRLPTESIQNFSKLTEKVREAIG